MLALSKRAVRECRFQVCDGRLTRGGAVVWRAIFERRGGEPVNWRVAAPFGLQGKEARHCELIERLVPAPAGIADDLGDQGVEIDFPASCDASRVAGAG